MARDEQLFKSRAPERRDGVDGGAFGQRPFQQLDGLGPALHAQNEPYVVHPGDALRLALSQAPADEDGAVGMQPRGAADGLERLLIAGAGDGAGVDEVHVRVGAEGHGRIARALEGL